MPDYAFPRRNELVPVSKEIAETTDDLRQLEGQRDTLIRELLDLDGADSSRPVAG